MTGKRQKVLADPLAQATRNSARTLDMQTHAPTAAMMFTDPSDRDSTSLQGYSHAALRIAHSTSLASSMVLTDGLEYATMLSKLLFNYASMIAESLPAFILGCSIH
jgi:hypothetical protein